MSQRALETAGFLGTPEGGSLYVRVYDPQDAAPRTPVVLVPADGEERTWSQRACVNLARYLARRGHPVVRFDFRGQGESDGAFEDTDLDSRCEDLDAVVLKAAATFGEVPWIVGLRLGASLSIRWAARRREKPPGVIAIEPIESGAVLLGEVLRKNIANQLVVHKKVVVNRKELRDRILAGEPVSCNGFLLARRYVESLEALDLVRERMDGSNLTVIRLASGASVSDDVVVDEAPFWYESTTVRDYPSSLFAAVAARLPEASGVVIAETSLSKTAANGRQPVSIEAPGGRVVGTWHPPRGSGSTSFLFLNPGPNDRSGPHGLYGRLATDLAERGYGVLRIDAAGVGESEGDDDAWQGRPVPELHREINHGAMLGSVSAALRWLHDRAPGPRVLFGLCGGASNAVLAGDVERQPDLELMLLGTPVLHLSVGVDGAALTKEALDDEVRVLGQKLRNPAYLWRLVTFQSDYAHLFRLARSRAKSWLRSEPRSDSAIAAVPLHPQTNERMLRAWERFTERGGATTFIFSEYDRLYGQFRDHFAPLVRGAGLPSNARVVVLEGANHNVTDRAAERQLLACLEQLAGVQSAR